METRAKELAEKATNSSEGFEAHDELVSHCDPTTITLVADVVAAARESVNPFADTTRLRDALAALDAHTNKVTP